MHKKHNKSTHQLPYYSKSYLQMDQKRYIDNQDSTIKKHKHQKNDVTPKKNEKTSLKDKIEKKLKHTQTPKDSFNFSLQQHYQSYQNQKIIDQFSNKRTQLFQGSIKKKYKLSIRDVLNYQYIPSKVDSKYGEQLKIHQIQINHLIQQSKTNSHYNNLRSLEIRLQKIEQNQKVKGIPQRVNFVIEQLQQLSKQPQFEANKQFMLQIIGVKSNLELDQAVKGVNKQLSLIINKIKTNIEDIEKQEMLNIFTNLACSVSKQLEAFTFTFQSNFSFEDISYNQILQIIQMQSMTIQDLIQCQHKFQPVNKLNKITQQDIQQSLHSYKQQ